ncbi:aspartate--tRNA ligase [Striga asiatica]|uniref:Aspartate--tRNA ligase n=1 Tax=Striga asiatica TaxID=4170 RepID=A0A5A7PSZ7_STRAF|nr:aspartate--tRNA ligase [Striga asiatica]
METCIWGPVVAAVDRMPEPLTAALESYRGGGAVAVDRMPEPVGDPDGGGCVLCANRRRWFAEGDGQPGKKYCDCGSGLTETVFTSISQCSLGEPLPFLGTGPSYRSMPLSNGRPWCDRCNRSLFPSKVSICKF